MSLAFLQAGRLLGAILAARAIGPIGWGEFGLARIAISLAAIGLLGVPNAVHREVPLLNGLGRRTDAERIAKETTTFVALGTFALSALLILSTATFGWFWSLQFALAAAALLIGTHLQLLTEFHLRAFRRFRMIAGQRYALGVASGVAGLLAPVVGLVGYVALLGGFHILVAFANLRGVRTWPDSLVVRWATIRRLATLGVPLVAVAVLVETLDRWIAVSMLGLQQLGLYTIALTLASAIAILPRSVAHHFYSQTAEAFAQQGPGPHVKRWFWSRLALTAVVTYPAVVVAWFLLPRLVIAALPRFVESIPALQICLVGIAVMPVASSASMILQVTGRTAFGLAGQVLAAGANAGTAIILIHAGFGIEGVAWGTVASYVVWASGALAAVYLVPISDSFLDARRETDDP